MYLVASMAVSEEMEKKLVISIIIIFCYYFCGGNLRIYIWNKPFFYGIYCCMCTLNAIYGTCNFTYRI